MSAISITDWEKAGGAPDCDSCSEYRATLAEANMRLAKVHALLRAVRAIEPKPDKPTCMDDDATELLVIAHAAALAKIKTRIDLYLTATGARL